MCVSFMFTKTDACADFPCLHGSTCLMTETGPTCECPEGFTGQHCEDGEFLQLFTRRLRVKSTFITIFISL